MILTASQSIKYYLIYLNQVFFYFFIILYIFFFQVRELLGIGKETAKFHLDKEKLKDFDVFVQSTSYNRVLMPDSEFLYDTGEGGTVSSAAAPVTPAAPVTKDEPSTSRGTGRGKRKKGEEEV